MTMIQINISDDLKQAFETAFPSESIEAVVERLLRAEVGNRASPPAAERQSLLAAFQDLSAKFPPMSKEELKRLRQEVRP